MQPFSLYLEFTFFKMSLIVHFGNAATYVKELAATNINDEDFERIKRGLVDRPCKGMVSLCDGGRVAMYLDFFPRKRFDAYETGVLAHECLHVAYRFFEHNSIPIDGNEELMCMAQQHVLETVLAGLDRRSSKGKVRDSLTMPTVVENEALPSASA